MASAASLIPLLKQGKDISRLSTHMSMDTLSLAGDVVVYFRYLGEGKDAKPQYFTLEEIATWTDDSGWEKE